MRRLRGMSLIEVMVIGAITTITATVIASLISYYSKEGKYHRAVETRNALLATLMMAARTPQTLCRSLDPGLRWPRTGTAQITSNHNEWLYRCVTGKNRGAADACYVIDGNTLVNYKPQPIFLASQDGSIIAGPRGFNPHTQNSETAIGVYFDVAGNPCSPLLPGGAPNLNCMFIASASFLPSCPADARFYCGDDTKGAPFSSPSATITVTVNLDVGRSPPGGAPLSGGTNAGAEISIPTWQIVSGCAFATGGMMTCAGLNSYMTGFDSNLVPQCGSFSLGSPYLGTVLYSAPATFPSGSPPPEVKAESDCPSFTTPKTFAVQDPSGATVNVTVCDPDKCNVRNSALNIKESPPGSGKVALDCQSNIPPWQKEVVAVHNGTSCNFPAVNKLGAKYWSNLWVGKSFLGAYAGQKEGAFADLGKPGSCVPSSAARQDMLIECATAKSGNPDQMHQYCSTGPTIVSEAGKNYTSPLYIDDHKTLWLTAPGVSNSGWVGWSAISDCAVCEVPGPVVTIHHSSDKRLAYQQTPNPPKCPKGYDELWRGTSFAGTYIRGVQPSNNDWGDEYIRTTIMGSGQKLGSPGACLPNPNPWAVTECSGGACYFGTSGSWGIFLTPPQGGGWSKAKNQCVVCFKVPSGGV